MKPVMLALCILALTSCRKQEAVTTPSTTNSPNRTAKVTAYLDRGEYGSMWHIALSNFIPADYDRAFYVEWNLDGSPQSGAHDVVELPKGKSSVVWNTGAATLGTGFENSTWTSYREVPANSKFTLSGIVSLDQNDLSVLLFAPRPIGSTVLVKYLLEGSEKLYEHRVPVTSNTTTHSIRLTTPTHSHRRIRWADVSFLD
ncbi:MAG: hypothetical protein EOO16_00275 [Chitinophagaceae bacterium]|nr:MAG: hypothetical protein EOO16_00275 [Chitinophagaceae bacterium]